MSQPFDGAPARAAGRHGQRGVWDASRALPLLLLGLLALWLLWQRDGLALLLCAGVAALCWRARPAPSSAPIAPSAALPSLDAGVRRMAAAIVPAWNRQLGAIQSTTQSGAQELLTSFSSLMELQDQLEKMLARQASQAELTALSQDMHRLSEQALHGLQFGDRLAQMVDILRQDTLQFVDQMPTMAAAQESSASAWLQALEARYTTEEQRLFHHGQPATPTTDKVDFF